MNLVEEVKRVQKVHKKYLSGYELRDAGWGALVSNHVLADATRYIMQFETGSGDYTKIRKNVVMGKSVADLYKKSVLFEKKNQEQALLRMNPFLIAIPSMIYLSSAHGVLAIV